MSFNSTVVSFSSEPMATCLASPWCCRRRRHRRRFYGEELRYGEKGREGRELLRRWQIDIQLCSGIIERGKYTHSAELSLRLMKPLLRGGAHFARMRYDADKLVIDPCSYSAASRHKHNVISERLYSCCLHKLWCLLERHKDCIKNYVGERMSLEGWRLLIAYCTREATNRNCRKKMFMLVTLILHMRNIGPWVLAQINLQIQSNPFGIF